MHALHFSNTECILVTISCMQSAHYQFVKLENVICNSIRLTGKGSKLQFLPLINIYNLFYRERVIRGGVVSVFHWTCQSHVSSNSNIWTLEVTKIQFLVLYHYHDVKDTYLHLWPFPANCNCHVIFFFSKLISSGTSSFPASVDMDPKIVVVKNNLWFYI